MSSEGQHLPGSVDHNEEGYMLMGAIVLAALSALIIFGALDRSTSISRSVLATRQHSKEYYNSEQTLQSAATWLRENSTGMTKLFSRADFYTTFDRTAPTKGSNDPRAFAVPTLLKIQGTNRTALLSTDSTMATSYFPASQDTVTSADFNPSTVFSSAALGNAKVRVTLVDAVPIDPTKDFGDPDAGNPPPQTDFQPVYRIDALRSEEGGGYLTGYVLGTMNYNFGLGFYGRDRIELRQDCDSYISNNGVYNASTNRRANCPTGTHGSAMIHSGAKVYGSLYTAGSVTTSSPYGGKVCSSLTDATTCTQNANCAGNSCNVPALPTYSNWNTYCPSNQGNVTASANSSLTVAGNAPSQKCWGTVTIAANKVLTLKSTDFPYFIDNLDIGNNGQLNISPTPGTGTINLYVRKISASATQSQFNGNQVLNTNNKPYQLRIHYLGTLPLKLNGTANINAFLVAPYAPVEVQGNFIYSGGIKTTALDVSGSASLRYDESGDITTLSDVTYRIRNVEERVR